MMATPFPFDVSVVHGALDSEHIGGDLHLGVHAGTAALLSTNGDAHTLLYAPPEGLLQGPHLADAMMASACREYPLSAMKGGGGTAEAHTAMRAKVWAGKTGRRELMGLLHRVNGHKRGLTAGLDAELELSSPAQHSLLRLLRRTRAAKARRGLLGDVGYGLHFGLAAAALEKVCGGGGAGSGDGGGGGNIGGGDGSSDADGGSGGCGLDVGPLRVVATRSFGPGDPQQLHTHNSGAPDTATAAAGIGAAAAAAAKGSLAERLSDAAAAVAYTSAVAQLGSAAPRRLVDNAAAATAAAAAAAAAAGGHAKVAEGAALVRQGWSDLLRLAGAGASYQLLTLLIKEAHGGSGTYYALRAGHKGGRVAIRLPPPFAFVVGTAVHTGTMDCALAPTAAKMHNRIWHGNGRVEAGEPRLLGTGQPNLTVLCECRSKALPPNALRLLADAFDELLAPDSIDSQLFQLLGLLLERYAPPIEDAAAAAAAYRPVRGAGRSFMYLAKAIPRGLATVQQIFPVAKKLGLLVDRTHVSNPAFAACVTKWLAAVFGGKTVKEHGREPVSREFERLMDSE